MDIGCGANLLCTRALLEKFPRMGCLVACDKVPIMTEEILKDEFLAEYVCKEILQFHLIDIVDCLDYRNVVNKIVCRNVLQQITDKELAFGNMYDLLRPGGHAGILFCIVNPVDACQVLINASRNWSQYRINPMPFFAKANIEDVYYKFLLEDIGFRVVRSEKRDVQLQFLNDQSFLKFLAYSTILLKIPEDRMTQFKEESVSLFKRLIGYSGSGPLCYEASELLLLAIKP
ncbi:uncharacterized protein TNIN_76441 [Trichonephila inaurata madagascariensis]|uniref:Methyltransferase type 11 domain-containing protein n=1 Tax=Trichonephila inaurata madagascariensis TaxID=2747483 RepID=A0A8X6YD81_9ARAC|nr:uncharacterized protein TNIN_76441 [Trichonephila inaurata madagascariensis]